MKRALALLSIFLTPSAFGGGMTSSGGEYITDERNPWFLGTAPVTYCIESGEEFSAPLDQIRSEVKASIEDWTNTLKSMGVAPLSFKLKNGTSPSLSLNFTEQTTCSHSTDLRFYFGVFNDEIHKFLQPMARYTVAFAGRTQYDENAGRGKGIIWLAPDNGPKKYPGPSKELFWSKKNVLFHVLTHELGHVFGVPHQETGIMTEGAPAGAVRDSAENRRVSSSDYVPNNWYIRKERVCTEPSRIGDDTIKNILEVSEVTQWQVCIGAQSRALQLNLEFVAKDLSHHFVFDLTKSFSVDLESQEKFLAGNYLTPSSQSAYDYSKHAFIKAGDFIVHSAFEINGKKTPVEIRTSGGRLSLLVAKDGKFHSQHLRLSRR